MNRAACIPDIRLQSFARISGSGEPSLFILLIPKGFRPSRGQGIQPRRRRDDPTSPAAARVGRVHFNPLILTRWRIKGNPPYGTEVGWSLE